jgi:hypothetical protein
MHAGLIYVFNSNANRSRSNRQFELIIQRSGFMQRFILTLMCLALLPQSAMANYMAVVNPNSGDLAVINDGSRYLSFSYYDWGPEWSGVTRKKTVVEKADAAPFTFHLSPFTTRCCKPKLTSPSTVFGMRLKKMPFALMLR